MSVLLCFLNKEVQVETLMNISWGWCGKARVHFILACVGGACMPTSCRIHKVDMHGLALQQVGECDRAVVPLAVATTLVFTAPIIMTALAGPLLGHVCHKLPR